MSDDHQHESPIKTPKQLITVIALSFLVPIILIVLLVQYVTGGTHGDEQQSPAMQPESVAERIAPVAALNLKDASGPKVYLTGEALFKQTCSACHGTPGIPSAPKYGDKAAWGSRLGEGLTGLFASVVKGKGAMPPRAGTSPDDVSDYELQRAIVYMANAGGANFQEPPAPAAAAPAAGAASGGAAVTAAAPASAGATATTPAAAAPAAAAPAATAAAGGPGKALFESTCQVCHGAGVAGAPKFGDKAAWAPRIAQGMPTLYKNATTGKGAMPPRGSSNASDADLKAAVDYMVSAAK
jgi:cytochrome c5